MRRSLNLLVAVGAVSAAALTMAIMGYAATGQKRPASAPRLAVVRANPPTIQGTGFRPRSRVGVTLTAGRTIVRRPVTNPRGAFTASFPRLVDRCTGWSVTATQRGSGRVVLHMPRPECMPAGAA